MAAADRKVIVDVVGSIKGLEQSFNAADRLSLESSKRIEDHFKNLKIDLSQAIKPPDLSEIKAPDLGGGIGSNAAEIGAAFRQALIPVNTLLSGLESRFSQVGDNIIGYLRKIDANIKFPTFDAAFTKLRGLVNSTFSQMEGKAGQYGKVLENVLAGAQILNRARTFFINYTRLAKGGFSSAASQATVLTKTIDKATSTAKGLGSQIAISLGFFGLAYKGVESIKFGISSASDLNETISKTEAILGDSAPAVKSFADGLARDFGLVKRETLDAAASFGGLGKGLGNLQGNALSDFTKEYTQLAADLQSYANIPTLDEASKALTIALSGEQSDTLKRLGVIVNDTTIKQYALANGFKVVSGTVSESDKFLIRRKLIMQGLSDVQGDLSKTSQGTANQMRKFSGTLSNLSTDIGTALLPAVNVAVKGFAGAASSLAAAFERNKERISGFAQTLAGTFSKVGTIITYILPSIAKIGGTLMGAFSGGGDAVGNFLPTWEGFAVALKTGLERVNSALASFIDWVKGIPGWIDATFGEGTSKKIAETALAIGGASVALSVLGSAFTTALAGAATLLGPLISIPVLAGAAGIALAYVTGSYNGLADAANAADFAVKNNTDMFDFWGNSVLDWINNASDNFKAFAKAVWDFQLGKGWTFKAIELKPSKETEAAIEAMRKNTFDAPKVAPPVMPKFDLAAVQAQVAAVMKPVAAPQKAFDPEQKKADDKAAKKIESFAKEFVEKTRTPLEKYNEAMKQATEALNAGKITKEQFQRADRFAMDEAGLKTENRFASAIESSSDEGYSMALRQGSASASSVAYKPKDLTKPTQDTAKNTAKTNEELRKLGDQIIGFVKPVILKFS